MAVYDPTRDMSPAAVAARLEAARQMVRALCAPRGTDGARYWTMSIPARPDHDPDLVIADSLRDVAELQRLHDRRVSELLEANNREVERRRAAEAALAFRPTHRHLKRGSTYQVIGTASLQAGSPVGEAAMLVVYRGQKGDLWARPEVEFDDGRFAPVQPDASPEAPVRQSTPGDNQDMRLAVEALRDA